MPALPPTLGFLGRHPLIRRLFARMLPARQRIQGAAGRGFRSRQVGGTFPMP